MTLAFIIDGAGFGEWIILLAVVLIVFGPRRLPEVARTIGRASAKFHRMAEGFRRELLDLDNEIANAGSKASREADEFFKIDGDEASAEPAIEA